MNLQLTSILCLLSTIVSGLAEAETKHEQKVCYGPTGDRGPRGPRGPQGLQGPEGDGGPQGDEGLAGRGSFIFCASQYSQDLSIEANNAVYFERCISKGGFLAPSTDQKITSIQVPESGVYQITFYARGSAKYNLQINGAPNSVPAAVGGVFEGAGGDMTHGQIFIQLQAGSVITVNAEEPTLIPFALYGGVETSIMMLRVA